jgi:hypothetical protein
MIKKFSHIFLLIFLYGCATTEPILVVDPSSVKDSEKVVIDREECIAIAANIDMKNEALGKSFAGGIIGGGAVAGAAALAYGAVFAPAIPFIILGGTATGSIWGSSVTKEEKKIKDKILKECMIDRGYRVYSAD